MGGGGGGGATTREGRGSHPEGGGGHNKLWGSFTMGLTMLEGVIKGFPPTLTFLPCLERERGGGGGRRNRFRSCNVPIL